MRHKLCERRPDLDELLGAETYLIDESKNPFGTIKDRKSAWVSKQAHRKGIDTLVLITLGNEGNSLIWHSGPIDVVCIVPEDLDLNLKERLAERSYVHEISSREFLSEEKRKEIAKSLTRGTNILDVTNIGYEAYIPIVKGIQGLNPDYLVVPGGGFSIFYGLYLGIMRYRLKTKLIGVTVKHNPIAALLEDRKTMKIDGQPFLFDARSLADKLATPYSPITREVVEICKQGHRVVVLDEEEVRKAYETALSYGIDAEPSASVVFGIAGKVEFKPEDKVVLLNTGKGKII